MPGLGTSVTSKCRHVASTESESTRHRGSALPVFGSRSCVFTSRQFASSTRVHDDGATPSALPFCEAVPGTLASRTMLHERDGSNRIMNSLVAMLAIALTYVVFSASVPWSSSIDWLNTMGRTAHVAP